MPKTYNKYKASKKLEVVAFAEKTNNCKAAEEYGIARRRVQEWRKMKPILMAQKPDRMAMRGSKPHWPQLEERLANWIKDERKLGLRVPLTLVKKKSLSLAEEMKITDFKASSGWLQSFKKRNRFAVRARTSVGQKLPEDWAIKMAKFKQFVDPIIADNNIELQHIGNMDEVPVPFDIIGNFTVDEKGKSEINITTTGHEKKFCTVVLCVIADGDKLTPMIIFKRKTIPNEVFPRGIVVQANESGWMNEEMMGIWIESVWMRRKNCFFNRNPKKSILILDSHRAHKTTAVKEQIEKRSQLAVIPGGLTKLLQPLDISVNKSFKLKLKECFDQHLKDEFKRVEHLNVEFKKQNEEKRTAQPNADSLPNQTSSKNKGKKSDEIKKSDLKPKHVSYGGLCQWVVKSWAEITADCIKNGFAKANIVGSQAIPKPDGQPSAHDIGIDEELDEEVDELMLELVLDSESDVETNTVADELGTLDLLSDSD